MKKLSYCQKELIEHIRNGRGRFELRKTNSLFKTKAFIYDYNFYCWYDWNVSLATLKSLIKKNIIEFYGYDSMTGDIKYRLVEMEEK